MSVPVVQMRKSEKLDFKVLVQEALEKYPDVPMGSKQKENERILKCLMKLDAEDVDVNYKDKAGSATLYSPHAYIIVESDFEDWWEANKKKNRALEAAAVLFLRGGTTESIGERASNYKSDIKLNRYEFCTHLRRAIRHGQPVGMLGVVITKRMSRVAKELLDHATNYHLKNLANQRVKWFIPITDTYASSNIPRAASGLMTRLGNKLGIANHYALMDSL